MQITVIKVTETQTISPRAKGKEKLNSAES